MDEGVRGSAADGVPSPPVGVDSEVGPPNDEDLVWATLARWRAERRRFALLTVVRARGFTPRKPGAHMLLSADGQSVGTVGGGAIEQAALDQARAVLAHGGSELVERHLTQDLGMCCGGEMSIFVEAVEPRPRLFVFGAGYIGRPLTAMATACGFEVTVVDGRPEWAADERFPGATVRCQDPEDAARALELLPADYVCVVTHDHAIDLRLRAIGYRDEEIARLHTPLGLSIGAATPEEIAVSVLAQLIAVRRGAPVEPGWVPPPGAGRAADIEDPADAEAPRPAGTPVTAPTEVEPS